MDWDGDGKDEMVSAGYEGIFVFDKVDGKWAKEKIAYGHPDDKGAGEVKVGRLPGGGRYVASVEPWHGTDVAVYTKSDEGWMRKVLVTQKRDGHALWCADLTGKGYDSLVAGYRRNSALYLFHPLDKNGADWKKVLLDDGGMDCEDATCADFDGDGKIDVLAGGRSTKNVKIYWNKGTSK